MSMSVPRELAALQRLTVKELRAKYAAVFGEATNANNRGWLLRRIASRLQANAEGDLSERARRRAAELATPPHEQRSRYGFVPVAGFGDKSSVI